MTIVVTGATGHLGRLAVESLLARGIPAPVARQLLVSGFLNEVVERLNHPTIAAKLHELIEDKFARH